MAFEEGVERRRQVGHGEWTNSPPLVGRAGAMGVWYQFVQATLSQ